MAKFPHEKNRNKWFLHRVQGKVCKVVILTNSSLAFAPACKETQQKLATAYRIPKRGNFKQNEMMRLFLAILKFPVNGSGKSRCKIPP